MHEKNVMLAEKLSHLLSDIVVAKFIAQGYHWNVKGIEFSQLHDFFGEIYEDYEGSIDPLAENIRKVGFDAPYFLKDFHDLTCVGDLPRLSGDSVQMVESLASLNKSISFCVLGAFEVATECNEQGIADFLAGRYDMHKKWQWQLESTLGLR